MYKSKWFLVLLTLGLSVATTFAQKTTGPGFTGRPGSPGH